MLLSIPKKHFIGEEYKQVVEKRETARSSYQEKMHEMSRVSCPVNNCFANIPFLFNHLYKENNFYLRLQKN